MQFGGLIVLWLSIWLLQFRNFSFAISAVETAMAVCENHTPKTTRNSPQSLCVRGLSKIPQKFSSEFSPECCDLNCAMLRWGNCLQTASYQTLWDLVFMKEFYGGTLVVFYTVFVRILWVVQPNMFSWDFTATIPTFLQWKLSTKAF